MDDWIHPAIGGRYLYWPSICWRAFRLVISHSGVSTVAPSCLSFLIASAASRSFFVPDRDSRSRFLAPFSLTIHSAIARPSPPVPPAMTYVLLASNVVLDRVSTRVCIYVSGPIPTLSMAFQRGVLTITGPSPSISKTILPILFPD